MKSVLIVTDVLLDFYLDRKPFSDDSLQLLLKCEQKQFRAYITPVIVANTYYILRRHATHHYVVERLQVLLNTIHVLAMDQKQVLAALESKFTDFEDALQYFSAVNSNKIDAIITRNIKDYKKSALPVFTPNEFLATFA